MNDLELVTHSYQENGQIKTVELDVQSPSMQTGEVELWKYVEQKGTFAKHDSKKICLTNFRIYVYDYETSTMSGYLLLSAIEDIIIRNKHRRGNSVRTGFFTGRASGFLVAGGIGFSQYTSKNVGDLHFMRNGMDYLTIGDVPDPDGFAKYVKAVIRQVYPKKELEQFREEKEGPQVKKAIQGILHDIKFCLDYKIGDKTRLENFQKMLENSKFDTWQDLLPYQKEMEYAASLVPEIDEIKHKVVPEFVHNLEKQIREQCGFTKENFHMDIKMDGTEGSMSFSLPDFNNEKFLIIKKIVENTAPYPEIKDLLLSQLESEFAKQKDEKHKCTKCGTENPKDSSFCNKCGKNLNDSKCPKCGYESPIGASFCNKCGKKLG